MKHQIHDCFQRISKIKPNNLEHKHVNEWIKMIKSMKEYDYKLNKTELRQWSVNTSKIIRNCNGNINEIKNIHYLIKDRYDNDIFIKTALIHAYGIHSNYAKSSLDVFNSITDNQKDAVIISIMMKILIKHNQNQTALKLYDQYNNLTDDKTHILALKASANSSNFDKGQQILNNKIGKHNHSIYIKTALIDFYGKFGQINDAMNEFNIITEQQKNTVSLNAILTAHINNGYNQNAFELYNKYKRLHDEVSHTLAIKACTNNMDFDNGKLIHSHINTINNVELYNATSIRLKNTSIDFYGKFEHVFKSRNIFDSIENDKKDVVTIN
eukprot:27445_1